MHTTMKTSLLLLIPYVLVDIFNCEVIGIRDSSETGQLNASAILDMAILGYNTRTNNYTQVSRDISNSTFIPWPITRAILDGNQTGISVISERSTASISSPVARKSQSFRASANLSSKTHSGSKRAIPAGQWMYPGWTEISVKPNKSELNTKSDAEDIFATATAADVLDEGNPHSVPRKGSRHRVMRRKFDGIKRQYSSLDENTYGPDEEYAVQEHRYTSLNSDPENNDVHPQKYVGQGGDYELENYNPYSPESINNNQYYGTGPNVYVGNAETLRRPRPSSLHSRLTVGSLAAYNDRGVSSPSLISIFFTIGSNLLLLFKIALGSGLSIAIPIIALKLFLIPLKILKFIKIVKIFLKLIFVVPFLLRMFAPAIYSSIGHRDSGFSNKVGTMTTSESRHDVELAGMNSTWWNDMTINLNNSLLDFGSSQKCSSRVACELGSYLASSNKMSEKLLKFLETVDFEEGKDFNDERNEKDQVTRAFLTALTQRWTYGRCEVFTCEFSLL